MRSIALPAVLVASIALGALGGYVYDQAKKDNI